MFMKCAGDLEGSSLKEDRWPGESWQCDTEPFTSGSPGSSTALVKDGTEPSSPARGCSMRNVAGEEQPLTGWRRGTVFFVSDEFVETLGKREQCAAGLDQWHGLSDIVQASPLQAKTGIPMGCRCCCG